MHEMYIQYKKYSQSSDVKSQNRFEAVFVFLSRLIKKIHSVSHSHSHCLKRL